MKRMIARDLPVTLTQEEVVQRSRRMSEAMRELDEIEAILRAAKNEYKEANERIDAEIRHLAGIVRTGKELRPVVCERKPNWTAGTIEIFRTDTGELVDFTPMTAAERQGELAFEDDEPRN